MINSHDHFGMNLSPRNRFDYRNVLECGPLRTEGYAKRAPDKDKPGNTDVRLSYGASVILYQLKNDSVTFHWPLQVSGMLEDYQIKLVESFKKGGK